MFQGGQSAICGIPAACILHGSQSIVRDLPQDLRRKCSLTNGNEETVFTQLTLQAGAFRDSSAFNNGTEVLLQRFAERQRVRILSVSSGEKKECQSSGIAVRTA